MNSVDFNQRIVTKLHELQNELLRSLRFYMSMPSALGSMKECPLCPPDTRYSFATFRTTVIRCLRNIMIHGNASQLQGEKHASVLSSCFASAYA